MVEPAVPEGVGPPVAAYDPDALLHERIGHEEKAPRFGRVRALERGLQREDPFALSGDIGLRVLRSRQERAGERLADARGERLHERPRLVLERVQREAEPETELRVVLEERIRPRRAAAVRVRPVGGRQEVAAVDRGAPGGVRDERAVAEELREALDVWRSEESRVGEE